MCLAIREKKESLATGKVHDGKLYTENPRVRFDEMEIVSMATPRCRSLICKKILLLASMAVATDVLAWTEKVGDYEWTYDIVNQEAVICAGVSPEPMGEIVIPAMLGGYSVTKIDSYALYGCSGVTSVTIPDSVTSIGWDAFTGCDEAVYDKYSVPNAKLVDGWAVCENEKSTRSEGGFWLDFALDLNGVRGIAEGAFNFCYGLKSVKLPNDLKNIAASAFRYCGLTMSVTIPDSVTSIEKSAFEGCSGLKDVTIGNGVTNIGWMAFKGCSKLANVTIGNSVMSIENNAFEGCGSLTNMTIPESVASVGVGAFYGCNDSLFDIASISGVKLLDGWVVERTDPYLETLVLSGVRGIVDGAFKDDDNLFDVMLSDIVMGIGYSAFMGSTVTNLNIGKGITHIKSSAFAECRRLTSVTIPDGVTSIGRSAFAKCIRLQNVNIGNAVTDIDDFAFQDCSSLEDISIGNGVTNIGIYAFSECRSIKRVTAPQYVCEKSLSSIFNYSRDSIQEVVLPIGVTSISDDAFSYCRGLISVTIPDSVTSIGKCAFERCSGLTSVTIPDSVTTIGDYAFQNCSGLVSVTIPDSVTTIGDYAFQNCSGITSMTIPNSVIYIGSRVFYGCDGLVEVAIPQCACSRGLTSVFAGCPVADNEEIVILDGVTSIGAWAFSDCEQLKSVTMPNSVTNIDYGAFQGCSNLANINIPDSVASIGAQAFDDCSSLANINIPDSVASIGHHAFQGCSNLANINIPDSVASIGPYAFVGCSNLASVSLGEGLTCIGQAAFLGCSALKRIIIPDGVTSMEPWVFSYCVNLESVSIPDSVTDIIFPYLVFEGCPSITSVRIPQNYTVNFGLGLLFPDSYQNITNVVISDKMEIIVDYALEGCSSLESVVIPNSITNIGHYAFSGCTSLSKVEFEGNAPTVEWDAFESVASGCVALVPRNSTGWGVKEGEKWNGLVLKYVDAASTMKTYTLTFDANGGSVAETSRRVVADGAIGELPTPTRSGNTFAGWFTGQNGGERVTESTTVADDATFYALWLLPNCYGIVFDPGEGGEWSMECQSVEIGKVAKLNRCTFAAPTGKRFAGWRRLVDAEKGVYRRYDDGLLVFNLAEPGEVVVMDAVWE